MLHTSPNKKCPSEKLWCYESPGVLQAGFYSPDNQTFLSSARPSVSSQLMSCQSSRGSRAPPDLAHGAIHQRRLLQKVATVLLQSQTNSTGCSRRKAPLTSPSPRSSGATSLPAPSSQRFFITLFAASSSGESLSTQSVSPSPGPHCVSKQSEGSQNPHQVAWPKGRTPDTHGHHCSVVWGHPSMGDDGTQRPCLGPPAGPEAG